MAQRMLARIPLLDADAHQMPDEVLGRLADLVPVRCVELEVAFQYLRKQIGVVLVVERRIAAQQDVRDDTDAPHVDRLAVRLLGEHLGCHVAGCAARSGHDAGVLHFRQTKVADHDLAVLVGAVVEQVFRLRQKGEVREFEGEVNNVCGRMCVVSMRTLRSRCTTPWSCM